MLIKLLPPRLTQPKDQTMALLFCHVDLRPNANVRIQGSHLLLIWWMPFPRSPSSHWRPWFTLAYEHAQNFFFHSGFFYFFFLRLVLVRHRHKHRSHKLNAPRLDSQALVPHGIYWPVFGWVNCRQAGKKHRKCLSQSQIDCARREFKGEKKSKRLNACHESWATTREVDLGR